MASTRRDNQNPLLDIFPEVDGPTRSSSGSDGQPTRTRWQESRKPAQRIDVVNLDDFEDENADTAESVSGDSSRSCGSSDGPLLEEEGELPRRAGTLARIRCSSPRAETSAASRSTVKIELDAQTARRALQRRVASLESELAGKDAAAQNLHERLGESVQQVEELQEDLEEAQIAKANALSCAQSAEQKLAEVRLALEDHRNNIAGAHEQVVALQTEKAGLRQELTASRGETQRVHSELREALCEIDALRKLRLELGSMEGLEKMLQRQGGLAVAAMGSLIDAKAAHATKLFAVLFLCLLVVAASALAFVAISGKAAAANKVSEEPFGAAAYLGLE